jgi:hypothetical protein
MRQSQRSRLVKGSQIAEPLPSRNPVGAAREADRSLALDSTVIEAWHSTKGAPASRPACLSHHDRRRAARLPHNCVH